ncbi:hypothetical protein MRB53_032791 [Persea americana]|uniref:Uncharacterized protein n=1 Tax=Persea americana TaxID=3435 RepID=A0ACC2KTQ9_PERAE|nr:hypothetical protein MRB53_032791 [Persea americana]
MSGLSGARAIHTMATWKNPQSPKLWLAAVRAESRHGNKKEADILMAKALQECPMSGVLWAASIEMVSRPQRKTKSMDALKRCDYDPHVIAAVARLFWHEKEFEKARNWFNRAVTLSPDIEPKHGEKWTAVSEPVENSHQPVEAILKKVVVDLGNEESAFV